MSARDAILWLITTEKEWLEAFRQMCCHSPFRLRAQVWQFRDELWDRDQEFEHKKLEDALFELARILLPKSPAAKWDTEWATALTSEALRELNKRYVDGMDHSVLEPWAEKIDAAAEAEDRRAYREAVSGYLNAGLEAIEAVQRAVA